MSIEHTRRGSVDGWCLDLKRWQLHRTEAWGEWGAKKRRDIRASRRDVLNLSMMSGLAIYAWKTPPISSLISPILYSATSARKKRRVALARHPASPLPAAANFHAQCLLTYVVAFPTHPRFFPHAQSRHQQSRPIRRPFSGLPSNWPPRRQKSFYVEPLCIFNLYLVQTLA